MSVNPRLGLSEPLTPYPSLPPPPLIFSPALHPLSKRTAALHTQLALLQSAAATAPSSHAGQRQAALLRRVAARVRTHEAMLAASARRSARQRAADASALHVGAATMQDLAADDPLLAQVRDTLVVQGKRGECAETVCCAGERVSVVSLLFPNKWHETK